MRSMRQMRPRNQIIKLQALAIPATRLRIKWIARYRALPRNERLPILIPYQQVYICWCALQVCGELYGRFH